MGGRFCKSICFHSEFAHDRRRTPNTTHYTYTITSLVTHTIHHAWHAAIPQLINATTDNSTTQHHRYTTTAPHRYTTAHHHPITAPQHHRTPSRLFARTTSIFSACAHAFATVVQLPFMLRFRARVLECEAQLDGAVSFLSRRDLWLVVVLVWRAWWHCMDLETSEEHRALLCASRPQVVSTSLMSWALWVLSLCRSCPVGFHSLGLLSVVLTVCSRQRCFGVSGVGRFSFSVHIVGDV